MLWTAAAQKAAAGAARTPRASSEEVAASLAKTRTFMQELLAALDAVLASDDFLAVSAEPGAQAPAANLQAVHSLLSTAVCAL